MHPILFRLGDFPIGTYGLLLAIAFFAGTALARRQAAMDQIPGPAVTDLSVAMLVAAIVGSKVLMVIVDMINHQYGWSGVFSMSTLRAGGAIHGGIIAATLAFFWYLRPSKGLPLRKMGDALVPGVALGQAIGRLGCFSAGCCYGTDAHLPWAVIFKDPMAHELSGTPLFTPLHPVQLYTSLSNLVVMAILLLTRKKRGFDGQVFALYFILEGFARMVVETWRGDLDRGTWLGLSWLSTGRLTALGFVALGTTLMILWRRKAEAAA